WTAWLTRSHGGADPQAPRLEIEQGEAVLQPQPDVRSTGDNTRGHDALAAQVEQHPLFRDWFDHDDTHIRRHPETILNHGEVRRKPLRPDRRRSGIAGSSGRRSHS